MHWLSKLAGCPGAEHFAWWLRAWQEGARLDAVAATHHLLLTDEYPLTRVSPWFLEAPTTGQSVREILGCRTSRFGSQVVTYRGADDRLYDLVADVDPATGLLADARQMRSANGADMGAKQISELTADEREGVHTVFDAAYRHADHAWLDRRLAGLDAIGLGWKDGAMAGFSAGGIIETDLPVLGRRSFLEGGLTCIAPSAQNIGLSNAVGGALARGLNTAGTDFRVLHFATPVTVRAMFKLRRHHWPGNSITEVATSLASPSLTQRTVGAALADLAAAISFDADHWVIRSGHPVGESTADPVDLEPEYAQLFAHVDRTQGDALLGIFWHVEPPSEWWA